MKKAVALISSVAYLLSPSLAFAAETTSLCPEDAAYAPFCNLGIERIGPIVGTVIVIMFIIAVIIALIWLVIGGLKWITSSGDASKVETARNQIIAAVIGLIIVFLSFFILNFILSLFNLNLTNITIPTLPGFE